MLLNQSVWSVLSAYQLLPDLIARDDFKEEETKILYALIAISAINYDTFLSTAIAFPLVTLPTVYLSQRALMDIKFDAYTKESLQGDSTAIQGELSLFISLLFFVLINHYLTQRDLLILTIEKTMIKRH
jgi:hypothetical protein